MTRTRIQDLIDSGVLIVNDGYRAKNSELSAVGAPFARASNLNNGFQFDNADRFPECDLPRVGTKVSAEGDVVFTSKGTVGRFGMVRPDTPRFVYSPQLCFWRVLDRAQIEPSWLYYWMHGREFYQQYASVKGQTNMADYVNLRDQRRMTITLSPLPEQRAIASILGALDDKIALNRRMNETLESMAGAIYSDEMMSCETEPVTVTEFVRRGVLAVNDGYRAKNTELTTTALPFARASNVREGFHFVGADCFPRDCLSRVGEKVSEPNDLVFTSKGTVGRFAYVHATTPRFVYSPQLCFWRVLDPGVLDPRWLYSWMQADDFAAQCNSVKVQTDMADYVNLRDQKAMRISVPAIAVQRRIGAAVGLLRDRIECNRIENRLLSLTRDTLLPKLLSGEIRVRGAEKVIEAHA